MWASSAVIRFARPDSTPDTHGAVSWDGPDADDYFVIHGTAVEVTALGDAALRANDLNDFTRTQ